MSFIILKRVAKNSQYYLLRVCNIDDKKILYKFLDRDINRIINKEDVKDLNFRDFDTQNVFDIEKINLEESHKVSLSSKFKIHRFDPSEVGLRKYNYSLFDKEDESLFVPCCGKHEWNEDIKCWGKYRDDYDFFGHKISGYIVNDKRIFDIYHLNINDEMLKIRFIGESDFLIREFFDYLGIEGSVESLSKKSNSEYILHIKT